MKNHMIIIGGMGPQASMHLHTLLINNVGKNKSPDEFPLILHASIPSPDFIASANVTNQAIDMIQDVCASIPISTASVIGIACNTAHLLVNRLTHIPKGQFVSMIESVVDDIESAKHKKVGLLASPFTIKSELYKRALEARGMSVIEPDEADIVILNSVIHDVIGNNDSITLRPKLTKIAAKLQSMGADCILLGCTELPLVGVETSLPKIDSLSSLARAMTKQHQERVQDNG
jgi:aspartate racemase